MANPYFPTQRRGINGLSEWFWRRDGWAYLASIGILITIGFWFGIQKHWLWIEQITVSGNEYLTPDQITTQANNALDQHRWYIMPQRLYPMTDTAMLANAISAGLHDTLTLENIAVTKQFPNKITVAIKERIPGLVYIINDQYYYLDDTGVITAQVSVNDLDPHFPHIRERNTTRTITLGQAISQPAVMSFVINLNEQFTPATNLNIAEYFIPQLSCQTKEFIEKNTAMTDTVTNDPAVEELRNQQGQILDQIRKQEISVDQGLQLLDTMQTDSTTTTNTNSTPEQYIDLEATYVDAPCDYSAVIRDIGITTQEGPEILFDSSLDLQNQLTHLVQVKKDQVPDISRVTYFDLRFPDRVYFK